MSEASRRILIADELDPAALALLAERGHEVLVRTGLGEAELCAAVASVDALIVRSATRVTRAVLAAGTRLAVVGRAGVGVDNVDCDAATERGVVVMNAPDGNTTTTAELAIALLLALARRVPQAAARTRRGDWSKRGLVGHEIAGKTLGVVGLGRIGRVVAARGRGLGMRVIAYDPFLDREAPVPVAGVELCALDALLAECDFVSLHVPLSEATRHLLSAEKLALLKPGAFVINAARGGLLDEQALLAALEAGRLAGAALDVLEVEPPPPGHALLAREDVIVTPHLGASSVEAQLRVAHDIALQVADFFADGVPRNAVNAPPLDVARLAELAPYMLLAERMGRFLAQRSQAALRTLELALAGAIAEQDASHVRLALLVGALGSDPERGINFVNATHVAKERGLRVLESRDDSAGSFTSLIAVRATTSDPAETHAVAGTVFGREPRLVQIDGVDVDLAPSGTLLVTRHTDRPGVVGRIGTLLGDLGVNIRRIELGPPPAAEDAGRGLASGYFTLDGEPALDLALRVLEIDGMAEARLLRL